MKKLVLLSVSVVLALSSVLAQVVPVSPLAEGVKLLNYEKNKSALAFFKEALDKNPTNTENIFWYGEAVLAEQGSGMPSDTTIKKAKAIFQQAMQAAGNDPWLLVGMSHVQLLEGADANAVKQNLEVALTTTLLTKGKFKGKPNQDIVNAIGYIHAEIPSNVGDHRYAIDKLKETISAYESMVSPNLFINLGINYLKSGASGCELLDKARKGLNQAWTSIPRAWACWIQ
jgi:tetratricopeptide (TPR) repeat protein